MGETVTVEALFYGLLLQSGNDAALALARYYAGDVETFVARMNEKARALGMADTRFANPNGLDDEDHYSTAADMAVHMDRSARGRLLVSDGAHRQPPPQVCLCHINVFALLHSCVLSFLITVCRPPAAWNTPAATSLTLMPPAQAEDALHLVSHVQR